MKKDELLKQITPDSITECKLKITNEIFEDIGRNEEIKGSSHKAFAYAYYCLITYLYQNAIYGQVATQLNVKALKTILDYHSKNGDIDYLIKKRGILEEIGYTKTTRKAPINEAEQITLNYEIKVPLKTDNDTHIFDLRIFIHAMNQNKIGLTGFYLYQFINSNKNCSIKIGLQTFAKQVGVPETTLAAYLKNLEKYNYITNSHEPYFINAPVEERTPCTYTANGYNSIVLPPKNQINIRKVLPYFSEESFLDYLDKKDNFVVTDYENEKSEAWK